MFRGCQNTLEASIFILFHKGHQNMPLTVTQAKILSAHLSQLSKSLNVNGDASDVEKFNSSEIIGSLIYELGPFILPGLSNAISNYSNLFDLAPVSQWTKISGLCASAAEELDVSIDTQVLPGRSFREIIAALLEEIAPILIQILIGLFIEPDK